MIMSCLTFSTLCVSLCNACKLGTSLADSFAQQTHLQEAMAQQLHLGTSLADSLARSHGTAAAPWHITGRLTCKKPRHSSCILVQHRRLTCRKPRHSSCILAQHWQTHLPEATSQQLHLGTSLAGSLSRSHGTAAESWHITGRLTQCNTNMEAL
jgi:hypothetical protein